MGMRFLDVLNGHRISSWVVIGPDVVRGWYRWRINGGDGAEWASHFFVSPAVLSIPTMLCPLRALSHLLSTCCPIHPLLICLTCCAIHRLHAFSHLSSYPSPPCFLSPAILPIPSTLSLTCCPIHPPHPFFLSPAESRILILYTLYPGGFKSRMQTFQTFNHMN